MSEETIKSQSYTDFDLDIVESDVLQREIEARCIAELPMEIYVPNSINGYKDNPDIYSGIYKLGIEVISTNELEITYFRRYITKKEIVFSIRIKRDIDTVQLEIESFLKYMEENGIEVYSTEKFVRIFANFAKSDANGECVKELRGIKCKYNQPKLEDDINKIKNNFLQLQ